VFVNNTSPRRSKSRNITISRHAQCSDVSENDANMQIDKINHKAMALNVCMIFRKLIFILYAPKLVQKHNCTPKIWFAALHKTAKLLNYSNILHFEK
jgi:hypothetical protein